MLCENCKQKEATVYVSEVVNGQKKEHYLCDDCVKANEKDIAKEGILFNNFISELMKIAIEEGYLKSPQTPAQKKCATCGLSLKEFLEIGRFGCKECYITFNNELKNAFVNVHGNTKHVGKVLDRQTDAPLNENEKKEEAPPSKTENNKSGETKIEKLQEALLSAIKEEAYEEAARLRDEIRALKKEGTD